MTTMKALNEKPHTRNPRLRFDEGEVASSATPERGSLLYKENRMREIRIRWTSSTRLAV